MPGSEFPFRRLAPVLVVGAIIYGAIDAYLHREMKQMDGVLAPSQPLQQPISRHPMKYKGHIIDFLASYEIQARILSTENYYVDPGAKISPIDLALGWGPMSDNRNLRELKMKQSDRFYFYSWEVAPPLPERVITQNSANVHIVPADSIIEKQIKALRKGQVVKLTGALIMVSDFNGGGWKSSLTREDSGPGACELFYVESVRVPGS